MRCLVFAFTFVLGSLTVTFAPAGEIGFLEDFALAKDRAAVLKQLIPGSEEYYYYHCLHYQNTEQFDKVDAMLPGLGEPVHAYAGLRPTGRGVNYVIGRSRACPQLVNVAAIRSTGLTASLGIAEHVVELLGVDTPASPVPEVAAVASGAWWR